MVRIPDDEFDAVMRNRYVRPMDFTGKPLKGFVYVSAPGFRPEPPSVGGCRAASGSPKRRRRGCEGSLDATASSADDGSRSPATPPGPLSTRLMSVDNWGNSSGPVHAGPPLTLCASSSECATEHPSGERHLMPMESITELPSRWPRLAIRP